MAIKFLNSVAVDTDVLFVDTANESVGIGTTNPHYYNNYRHLTINGTSGAGLMLRNNGSSKYEQYTDSGGTIFYNFANVPLKFYTNATEKFRINGNGNVGIGTTNPASNKLVVAGGVDVWNSTNTLLRLGHNGTRGDIQAFASGAYGILAINSGGGNVGIGTTSPSETLSVLSGVNESVFDVLGVYNNVTNTSAAGKGAAIRIGNQISGNYSTKIATIYEDSNPSYLQPAMAFFTMHNSYLKGSEVERMRIGSAGNIKFNSYNSTNNTGTPTYLLGTDASGNVVKTNTIPGSGAGPYLPLAGGTMTGSIKNGDGVYSYWGTGDDLQIGHDGSNSYIIDKGVGDLLLYYSDDFVVSKYGTSEISIRANQDSSVELFFDNSKKFETTTDGTLITGGWTTTGNSITYGNIHFPDGRKAEFGTSQDLQMYHDGTNSYIKDNGTGVLNIQGSTVLNIGGTNGEVGIQYTENAGITLRHNNVVKFTTESTGVSVTGAATATTFLGDLNGTINTVTTAVTKANATNDTTVATTAFVQNLIGTIPAGLVFQGTWNAATNTPTLTSGSGTTGHFYIVSTSGSTNLDGVTDWVTGDWAVFIEQGATDAWEKIDNSSVLDGAGTGQTLPLWSGSGTSNTLTNSKLVQNTAGTLITAFTNSTGNTGNFITNSEGGGEVGLKVKSRVNRASLLVEDNDTGVYISAEGGLGSFGRTQGASTSNINIDGLGSVGIGTISPAVKLDVNGGGRFNTTTGSTPFYITRNGANDQALKVYVDDANVVFESIQDETADDYGGFIFNMDAGTTEPYFDVRKNNGTIMRIDGGGNVGIGTTSPAHKLSVESGTTPLHLNRTGGATALIGLDIAGVNRGLIGATTTAAFVSYSSGADPLMTVLNTGNVGIGTTSPDYKLDVAGTFRVKHANSAVAIQEYSSGATIWMDGVDGDFVGGDYFNISAYGATDLAFGHGAATKMTLKNTGNLGIGTTSPGAKLEVVVADDTFNDVNVLKLKRIWATGSGSDRAHGVSFTDNNSTLATIYADRTNSGANYNSDLLFATNTGTSGTSLSTRMIIKHTGNVGIGTTSPSYKLSVSGNIGLTDGVSTGLLALVGGNYYIQNTGAYSTVFQTNGAERMRITSAGDTGIGVTTPRAKLDVAGGIKVADDTDTAGANKVGTLRYRTSGNNSYVDMCMQTGASTYAWINVVQNNW